MSRRAERLVSVHDERGRGTGGRGGDGHPGHGGRAHRGGAEGKRGEYPGQGPACGSAACPALWPEMTGDQVMLHFVSWGGGAGCGRPTSEVGAVEGTGGAKTGIQTRMAPAS